MLRPYSTRLATGCTRRFLTNPLNAASRGGAMRTLTVAVVLAVCLSPRLTAQETASDTLLTVNHYLDWEQVGDPQVSPNGAQIIYTRRWVRSEERRVGKEVRWRVRV